jgi:NAD(P)-dependent dehydrogenase (short-subunit alcohol dehydrogenase family)
MRVVMTGATNGIGLQAAKRLLTRSDCSLVVGARYPRSAPALLRRLAEVQEVNLESLTSVSAFAAGLIGHELIHALVLNAGVQHVRRAASTDGCALTFAVNYLAHYVLLRSLIPKLADDARVVIASSGTRDPLMKTQMPPPQHADVHRLAFPDSDPGMHENPRTAVRRTYARSTLYNVMTARELARNSAVMRANISVCAFDPGFARNWAGAILPLAHRARLPIPISADRASRAPREQPGDCRRISGTAGSFPCLSSGSGRLLRCA